MYNPGPSLPQFPLDRSSARSFNLSVALYFSNSRPGLNLLFILQIRPESLRDGLAKLAIDGITECRAAILSERTSALDAPELYLFVPRRLALSSEISFVFNFGAGTEISKTLLTAREIHSSPIIIELRFHVRIPCDKVYRSNHRSKTRAPRVEERAGNYRSLERDLVEDT